jgi:hypothetical protein
MSKYKSLGFHDGLNGNRYREPNDLFDHIFCGYNENKRKSREDREYRDSYRDGEKHRRQRQR